MSHGGRHRLGLQPRPQNGTVRRWHRRLGIASTLVVVLLVVTGWALNHTDGLRLSTRNISAAWIVDWYGIGEPASIDVFDIGGDTGQQPVAWIDGSLYLQEMQLAASIERPAGVIARDRLTWVFAGSLLAVFGPGGEQVDRLYLGDPVQRVGKSARGDIVIETREGQFALDEETLEMAASPVSPVAWIQPVQAADNARETWSRIHRTHMLSMERVLLDIHSGRMLGNAGVWLVDMFALIFLVLAVSGLVSWIRCRDQLNGKRRAGKTRISVRASRL